MHIVLQTARMNRPWAEGQYRTVEWSKFVIVWNQAFLGIFSHQGVPSVLWQGIWPVKNEWWAAGMVICLNQGADLYMAQLMPLHSLSLASVKSRLVLPFWYRPTRVVPDKGSLNGCVCELNVFCCCSSTLMNAISWCYSVISSIQNTATTSGTVNVAFCYRLRCI